MTAPRPHQEDLPLTAIMAHRLFPGVSNLRVAQVAWGLQCDDQHVFNLIEAGRLAAINIATQLPIRTGRGSTRTFRRSIRIPVSAYDAFVRQSQT